MERADRAVLEEQGRLDAKSLGEAEFEWAHEMSRRKLGDLHGMPTTSKELYRWTAMGHSAPQGRLHRSGLDIKLLASSLCMLVVVSVEL